MHSITNGCVRFSKTNSTDPRQRVPLTLTPKHANQSQEPSLPSQVPIYPWVERSLWLSFLLKDTSVMTHSLLIRA